jgi:NAD+ synthase (glutamine-hydrolysing)
MNMSDLGFVRAAACAPVIAIADPATNARRQAVEFDQLAGEGVSLVLFPELAITGYSCEDLFANQGLLDASVDALAKLAKHTAGSAAVLITGAPWRTADGRLLNCAFVLAGGQVLGAVPKSAHPNYGEFYDKRWFASGAGVDLTVAIESLGRFRISTDQLFKLGPLNIGIEICEDLWAPAPPGVSAALAGADLIVNPSGSNELIAKADYRRDLVRMASAQRICGYLYASAGPTESTKDIVFGGHLLAAENGTLIAENERFVLPGSRLITEFDWQKLRHDRSYNSTFAGAARPAGFDTVDTGIDVAPITSLSRAFPRHPFVPDDELEVDARAQEILAIQATGLARRLASANAAKLVIGLSGGLDSTLAFLVCQDAIRLVGEENAAVVALTMPGPGTTPRTLASARALAEAGGAQLEEIDIDAAVVQHLADLDHPANQHDVVFENAQARERTQLLFNYANKVGGIVVGTGDLSELALGWCTYNADHMASYNVNASVPKTLIAYLVRWYARHRADALLAKVLNEVLDTPISPELLPPGDDNRILQETESIIGPYELHDFFLFHLVRDGASPEKIYRLAATSFADHFDAATVRHWLKVFIRRFFTQQFKRTTLPPGPKVGSVSLSPRGDWRMPDEVDVDSWLTAIDRLPD